MECYVLVFAKLQKSSEQSELYHIKI